MDLAQNIEDIMATLPVMMFGSSLPGPLYRALPQRAAFLEAVDVYDGVIARVIKERHAKGLDPANDVDFLGRAVQVNR